MNFLIPHISYNENVPENLENAPAQLSSQLHHCINKTINSNTTYLISSIFFFCYWKTDLLLFSLFPIKIDWKHMFLETIQSHWGFICSRRLFLTFGNLTLFDLAKLSAYKVSCKTGKLLNFTLRLSYLSYFRLKLPWKDHYIFENNRFEFEKLQSLVQKTFKPETKVALAIQHPWILEHAKFHLIQRCFKFETKIALFGYFWAEILKNYCHIWNKHPRNCGIVKFHVKKNWIWNQKCLIWVLLGHHC